MALGFNPDDVWKPAGRGFAQAVPARQGRVVHVTGQVALDDAGRVVGAGDVDRQFRVSVENI